MASTQPNLHRPCKDPTRVCVEGIFRPVHGHVLVRTKDHRDVKDLPPSNEASQESSTPNPSIALSIPVPNNGHTARILPFSAVASGRRRDTTSIDRRSCHPSTRMDAVVLERHLHHDFQNIRFTRLDRGHPSIPATVLFLPLSFPVGFGWNGMVHWRSIHPFGSIHRR